jgi:hypothetical protein
MRTHSLSSILFVVVLFINSLNAQSVVTIIASKDNTLYQSATGAFSNGAGTSFFVGRVGANGGGNARRGLIAFDIAANVPAGASIDSVKLTLRMSKSNVGAQTIALHRVSADWGEGVSNAGGEEGGGAAATTGDATWIHRFFNTSLWTNAGGDFAAAASASRAVSGIGAYIWGSTPQMVADVQAWLDTPSSNFGWLLLGNESTFPTSKRFDAREHSSAGNRPALTVFFKTMTDVENEGEQRPAAFALAQNYPNPFNPSTTIRYELQENTPVILEVYNVNGQVVKALVNEMKVAGSHTVVWDGRTDAGRLVSGGVYICKIKAGSFVQAQKMTLLK